MTVETMSKSKRKSDSARNVQFTPEAYDTMKQIASSKRWTNKVVADEAMKALAEKIQREAHPSASMQSSE